MGKLLTGVPLILIILYLVYQHYQKSDKMGYIIIPEVYNQFELKKDFQKKYERSHTERKKKLDSLAIDIRMLGQKIDGRKGKDTADIGLFRRKRSLYFENRRMLNQDDSAQMKQYDEQILEQLNQYVKDYGNQHHYKFIFGNGNGNIMQADSALNITGVVSKYVNERYQDKTK
jgi:outer membrane protein